MNPKGKEERESTSSCINRVAVHANCCQYLLSPVMPSLFIDLSFQTAGDSHRHPPVEQRQRGGSVAVSRTHDRGGEGQSGGGKSEQRADRGPFAAPFKLLTLPVGAVPLLCIVPLCVPLLHPCPFFSRRFTATSLTSPSS